MSDLTITSFGYGHGPAPTATITVDLREVLHDPHISPELRNLTANDDRVRATVWDTPGAIDLLGHLFTLAGTLIRLHQRTGVPVSIAVGCSGGRHRAPTLAAELHDLLTVRGRHVDLHHRDMHREVIEH